MLQQSTSVSTKGNATFQSNQRRSTGSPTGKNRCGLPMVAGQEGHAFHLEPCCEPGSGYAHRAYVVLSWEPAGRKLCMIERGQSGRWLSLHPQAGGGNSRTLRRLARRLNIEHGVSGNAALALFVDWQCSFKIRPVNPNDYADFRRDEDRKKAALRGEHCGRAASDGYLNVHADTCGMPINAPIRRSSIRHSWLMAHLEYRWADLHGRVEWVPNGPGSSVPSPDVSRLLPTEQAAHLVCQRANALSDAKSGLRQFSRREETLCRNKFSNHAEADQIRGRHGSVEHRQAVKEAWAKSRPALCALLDAIDTYHQARSSLAAVTGNAKVQAVA